MALSFVVAAYVFKLTDPASGYTRVDQAIMLVLAIVWLCFCLISGTVFPLVEFLGVSLIGFSMVFLPFSQHLNLGLFFVFLTLGVFFIFSARQASKSILENSIKLKSNHILSVSLPKIILILSLLMSLSFWTVRFGSGFNLKTSDVGSMTSGFGVFYPGYNEKTTIGEFIERLTEKQSNALLYNLLPYGIPDALKDSVQPEAFKSSVKKEANKTLLNQISALFGRQVSPTETITDLIHSWMKSFYDNLGEKTKRVADFVVLLVVFGLWLGVFQVFSFVVYGIFWLVLKLLLALKVIKVSIVTVEKEVITW